MALRTERGPHDVDRYHEDIPNLPVVNVVKALDSAGSRIIFFSGRDERYRAPTEAWLKAHVEVSTFALFMRPAKDVRSDWIIKLEMFDRHIRDSFNVIAAIDDRNQVVRAYRDVLGLTVFQVADGDF